MTNKEKTILFLKAICLLIWVGVAVMTSAAALNGDASAFVKTAAVANLLINLGLAGKTGYDVFFK